MSPKLKYSILLLFAMAMQFAFAQQTKQVSGTVIDEDGVPLPGVTIQVKDTDQGTSTDFDGKYEVKAKEGATLLFSFVGFQDIEKEVGSESTIDIQLTTDTQALDQVVVVAFGKQKKQNLTGSVSMVSEEAIKDRPVNNVIEALQGTASGLDFNLGGGGGQLDNSKGFSIRGTGTVGSTASSPPCTD